MRTYGSGDDVMFGPSAGLYALLEAEARSPCQVVGLDPGVGIVHADFRSGDSFALDLMEAVRPQVDAYVLDLLGSRVFRASDFYETPRVACRLRATLTRPLAETVLRWAEQVAPVAEQVAQMLAEMSGSRIIGSPLTFAQTLVLPLPIPTKTSSGSKAATLRSSLNHSSSDVGTVLPSSSWTRARRTRLRWSFTPRPTRSAGSGTVSSMLSGSVPYSGGGGGGGQGGPSSSPSPCLPPAPAPSSLEISEIHGLVTRGRNLAGQLDDIQVLVADIHARGGPGADEADAPAPADELLGRVAEGLDQLQREP